MSIDYMLLRIHSNCDPEALNELLPFCSQQEIIAHLCTMPEFKLNSFYPLIPARRHAYDFTS